MSGHDIFLILLGDIVCLGFGYSRGWHRGFTDAEQLWEPFAQRLDALLKRVIEQRDAMLKETNDLQS